MTEEQVKTAIQLAIRSRRVLRRHVETGELVTAMPHPRPRNIDSQIYFAAVDAQGEPMDELRHAHFMAFQRDYVLVPETMPVRQTRVRA